MKLYGIDYLIVGIFSFIGGAAYAKKFYKDKYKQESEDTIADVKASYEQYFSKENEKEEKENKTNSKEDASVKKDNDPFTSASSLFVDDEEAKDYVKNYIDYSTKEEDLAEEEHPKDDAEEDAEINIPCEIGIDDYLETNGQGKVCISYYAGSKVFVKEDRDDDEPEFIQDHHTLFGYVLEKTGWIYSYKPKNAYIRNKDVGTDFEVVWYEGEYDW